MGQKDQILLFLRLAAAGMGNASCGPRDGRELLRSFGLSSGPARNKAVPGGCNYTRVHSGEAVHIIIVALDYKKTENPLTCTTDGDNFYSLARACGHTDIQCLYNEDATAENVAALIAKVGATCAKEDYFVFYYSGHGSQVKDQSGDEADGLDECFCFVDKDGQVNMGSVMIDDYFARLIFENVPEKTRTLIITDCCHSGTLADMEKPIWYGREACSISGCLDSQTSGDIGCGGIMTHSLLLAIGQLKSMLMYGYSVADLYNMTLEQNERVFKSAQDVCLHCPPSFTPDRMAWPFIPVGAYEAPYFKRDP